MARKIKKQALTIETIFDEFILDCQSRNLAQVTINNYKQNIGYFSNYLTENKILFSDITSDTIKQYITYLQANTSRNTTSINTLLRHVKTFLNYCYEQGYIAQVKIRSLKVDSNVKHIYTDTDIKKLLVKPNLNNCGYSELRSWAIINLLVSTGIRRSSLVNIKLSDIDFKQDTIRLTHTKTRKLQVIKISPTLEKALKLWLTYRIDKSDYLFTTEQGAKLNPSSLTNNIYKYNKSRGVSITSIHAFRHYFSIKCVESGLDIFLIAKLLGHSDISTTQIYLKSLNQFDFIKNNSIDILSTLQ